MARVAAFHSMSAFVLAVVAVVVVGGSEQLEEAKAGRCPPAVHGCAAANETVSPCSSDPDCPGALKCCPGGCDRSRVCARPVFSACEHARRSADKRAKALLREDPSAWLRGAAAVRCRQDGAFEEVQCGPRGECWCVDGAGYEVGGTRQGPSVRVNCTAPPRACAGPTCRMLCPYDFELDEEGCPLCRCRDPCAGVRCPGNLRCQLEEVECERQPCPPVPDCKSPRALGDACPVGAPLSSGAGGKPLPCGPGPDGPECPPYFSCFARSAADEYGVCCPSVDTLAKPGTCPNVTSCEGTPCLHDMECEGLKKCCVADGCEAPRCVPMAESTKCLQQQILARLLSSREKGPSYVPQCTASGAFEARQCSRNGEVCWCVDALGDPVPRTVRGSRAKVLCDDNEAVRPRGGASFCRTVVCDGECPSGFVDGPDGCPTCRCKDPCADSECPKGEGSEGPCPVGEPSEDAVDCAGGCPSTHFCAVTNGTGRCCPRQQQQQQEQLQQLAKPGSCPERAPGGGGGGGGGPGPACSRGMKWDECEDDADCPADSKCCSNECGVRSCVGPLGTPSAANPCESGEPLRRGGARVTCAHGCPSTHGCRSGACCPKPARSKCERLRDAALRRNATSRFLPKCRADGAWEALQCLPGVGVCWCSTGAGAYVAGSAVRGVPECPSPARSARKLGPTDRHATLCDEGVQVHVCPANLCDGKVCLAHPGASCRVDPCGGCRFAFYSARVAVDCSLGLSPCQRRVQLALNSPAWRGNDAATLKDRDQMPLAPPTCAPDGSYETLQTRGRWSWCVDPSGRPANCSGSHAAVLPACPDATVCADQCLDAYCEAHPEALCVADPCDGCRVSFVSPATGETLGCEDPCLQPVEVGPCRGAITAWYFDREDGSCKTFPYGGCRGNDNRFRSREECVSRCERPVDVCSLPKRVGVCRASMKRWSFDKKSRSCEPFVFGGCDGNANNFETKEECEARCPDAVLCNRVELGKDPVARVRSEACANATCPGDPFAVCTADPCATTGPYFVDTDGARVSCEATDDETPPAPTETEAPASGPDTACRKRLERVLAANSSSPVAPACDANGDFKPTQCDNVTGVCWCVDEAGQAVVGAGEFPQGHRQCAKEKVKSVSVHLSFAHEEEEEDPDAAGGRRASVRNAVLGLLTEMAVPEDGIENGVSVEVSAGAVDVRFTLVGERKLVAAASLEDQIAAGTSMVLRLEDGTVLRLDRSASTVFQYARASGDSTVPDDGAGASAGAAVAIAVVAAALTFALFVLVVVHRRRSRGYFPGGGSETSSVVLTPSSLPEPSPGPDPLDGDKSDGDRVLSGRYESLYVTVDDRWQSKA